KTGSTPKGAEEKYYAEDGLKWFTPADFITFPYIDNSIKKLSDLGAKEVKTFPQNSVLLIGIGATMGKVALVRCQCSANQQINCIQCKNDLLPLFLTFHLATITDYLFKCGKFNTLPILNQEETKDIYIPLPPLSEQHRIASYLDTKCAEIDAIIAQKQELLDKLATYKKSLIFECVTGKREVAA
ncbi:restriction endonuclease subunit S, partial [uncultured Desulfovibrio sp.]